MFSLANNAAPVLFLTLMMATSATTAQSLAEAERTAQARAPAADADADADAVMDEKVLISTLLQFKVFKNAQGKEEFAEADSVKPGDIIEYRTIYTNNSGWPIAGLTAELPIPDGLEYLPQSAKPGAGKVQAATQNGAFAPEPLSRTVNGRAEPVPYNEYRRLRWALGALPARGLTTVSARARVETATGPTARPAAPVAPALASASAPR